MLSKEVTLVHICIEIIVNITVYQLFFKIYIHFLQETDKFNSELIQHSSLKDRLIAESHDLEV